MTSDRSTSKLLKHNSVTISLDKEEMKSSSVIQAVMSELLEDKDSWAMGVRRESMPPFAPRYITHVTLHEDPCDCSKVESVVKELNSLGISATLSERGIRGGLHDS